MAEIRDLQRKSFHVLRAIRCGDPQGRGAPAPGGDLRPVSTDAATSGKLDDLSKSRGIQVVLSTHSKEIINYVDPSRLVLVERGARSASSSSEAASQLTILQSLGEIDNVDAYTLVKNRRCLFVEGPTDVPIMERIAAKLGESAFASDERVVIIPVGGAERFEHVEQLNVLENVLGGAIVCFEIRVLGGDCSDYSRQCIRVQQIALYRVTFKNVKGASGSGLIRNPGLVPSTVSIAKSVDVSAEKVERLILEETEKLRELSIDRAAERYSRDVHRAGGTFPGIPEANRNAREFVDTHWGTPEGRLIVVPGKKLLGAVRARLQAEYGASFGNPRLLEEFAETEVPAEIADLVRAISAATGQSTPN